MAENKRPEVTKGKGKGIQTVKELLAAPSTLARFKAYAPKSLDYERLFKVAMLAVSNNPLLGEASPMELLRAMMGVTSLGLEINSPLQHAFLIPFKRRDGEITIQVIIGYPGLLELCFRSQMVSGFSVNIVTKKEVASGRFEYKLGTGEFIDHTYDPDRDEDKDEPAFVYAVVTMADGRQKIEVMPWKAVERTRNGSSGFQYARSKGEASATYKKNPWVAHLWAMGKKTSLRQIVKLLPRTSDMAKAIAMDEGGEREDFDLSTVVELDPAEWTTDPEKSMKDRPQADKPKADDKPKAEAKPKANAEPAKDMSEKTKEPERAQRAQEPKAEQETSEETEAENNPQEDETQASQPTDDDDGWFGA